MASGATAAENTRLQQITKHLSLFKQRATAAQTVGDFRISTSWQLQMMDLQIERDRINLAIRIRDNSPTKSYWNKSLQTHLDHKAIMMRNTPGGVGVSTSTEAMIHRDDKAEIEATIISSGIKQALADANAAKNWAEAIRLSQVIQQYRNTGIWIDYKETYPNTHTNTLIDSAENTLLTLEQQDRLVRLPSNIKYVENQYNNETTATIKAKFKLQLQRLKAELNELQSLSTTTHNPTTIHHDTHSFIEEISVGYAQGNKNQDWIHNRLIKFLLDMKYPQSDQSTINPFDPLRGSNLGFTLHPLYLLRNGNLNIQGQWGSSVAFASRGFLAGEQRLYRHLDLSAKNIVFSRFIRDFIQVQGSNGSFDEPMRIENLIINDLMADEEGDQGFVSDFNNLVDQISNHQDVRDLINNKNSFQIKKFAEMAHRDGIQLIPINSHARFAGAVLDHVTIQNNIIYSKGALQGIFCSDGAFRNLHINNNAVEVNGAYTISISGMLSGSISNNTDLSLQPLAKEKITLYPLRMGGGANILVIGFDNAGVSRSDPDYYEYEAISGVSDFRRCGRPQDRIGGNPASFYTDVHMKTFLNWLRSKGVRADNAVKMKALMSELVADNKAKLIADPESLADPSTGNCT